MKQSNQDGFALFITLIMLAAMTLLAVGLIRAVDTANQVINNVTFKQMTLAAADSGTEAAVSWLGDTTNDAKLIGTGDYSGDGYYGSMPAGFVDYTGLGTRNTDSSELTSDDVDWMDPDETRKSSPLLKARWLGADAQGNRRSLVIQRMCSATGGVNPSLCVTASSSVAGGSGNSKGAGGAGAITGAANEVAYRVTTRTRGPKNSVSYVQTVLMRAY